MIGCIFKNQSNHHVHKDHNSNSNIEDLRELGIFKNSLFLRTFKILVFVYLLLKVGE